MEDLSLLPTAAHTREVLAEREGVLTAVKTELVGVAGMMLGAGRRTAEDPIDHAVGITVNVRLGDRIHGGDPLALIHYNDEARAAACEETLKAAFELADEPMDEPPTLIHEVLR